MKFLIATSILSFYFFSASAGGTTYTSERDRQGLDCYKTVRQTGTESTGYRIECKDAGDNYCKFEDGTIPSDHVISINSVNEQVQSFLNNGELEGSRETSNLSFSWEFIAGKYITRITIIE